MLPIQNETPIYCTKEDIMAALKSAFMAGQESPYELKSQEIKRLVEGIPQKVEQAPQKQRRTKEEMCPMCGGKEFTHKVVRSGLGSTCKPFRVSVCSSCGNGMGV